MASLCVGNTHTRGNHDGFIAGACAVGAGLLAAAGAVAFSDWCCSETDDQLIGRVSKEYYAISCQYQQTMDYFGQQACVGIYPPQCIVQYISEPVLYEFATFVWNSGVAQADYRSRVASAKYTLQSCVKDVRKRIHSLEGKYINYEDQKRLATMRNVLRNCEQLLTDMTLFAEFLECHKTYFNLYDVEGKVRNQYLQEINIVTSGRYTAAMELKRYILSQDSSQYPFRNFVKVIDGDISALRSDLYNLKYNYAERRDFASSVIKSLSDIRDIVVSDSRYQEELYQWEQARLERRRIEAFEAQMRLEHERIRAIEQQNRILQERNRLEKQRMYAQPVVYASPMIEEVSVTVTF